MTPFGLPGHQSLEGAYASGKFSPLSEDDYVILDQPGIPANRRSGSWVLTYGFDQFLVVDDEDPDQGLGDLREHQPRRSGHQPGPLVPEPRGRRHQPAARPAADSWGVGYYYLGTSSVLRQTLRPVAPIGNEQGFELYYNAAITSWFTLTADIQAVDPAQFDARSAFLFGLRAKIDF